MKRPCFALTLLLALLAGSFAVMGPAHAQSNADHATYGGWHDVCPYAPGESSGSVGLCDDEDARWQAHQIEERFDYLRNYDEASLDSEARQEPTPAAPPAPVEEPALVEEPATPATLESTPAVEESVDSEFGYRSGYDYEYDSEVYPPAAPAEPLPARQENVEELDPYWTENTLPAEVAVEEVKSKPDYNSAENSNVENHSNTSEQFVPYSTENKLPANEASGSDEIDPYWTNNDEAIANEQSDDATIDPQWAKDAVETVESWIEKLNSREAAAAEAVENAETNVESPGEAQTQVTPVPSAEALLEKPAETVDPTYGAHLWDDCDLDPQAHSACERPAPAVTNYGVESTPVLERNESFNVIEHRAWLLVVAHSLNEAGTALQSASQNLVRIANESTTEDSASNDGVDYEEYLD